MTFASIVLVLEWVSFLTALFSLKKLGTDGRFIVCFLAFVVLAETVGYIARICIDQEKQMVDFMNIWYNSLIPAQCISLLLFYYKKTNYDYWKYLIKGFIGIVLFITILQFFVSKVTQFNTFNYTLQAVFISACSLHYLFELMNSKEIEEVTRDPFMYVSIGLLLFYLGTLPFNSMKTYLYEVHRGLFYIYYYLFFAFNYFLYGIITFGILCTKKK